MRGALRRTIPRRWRATVAAALLGFCGLAGALASAPPATAPATRPATGPARAAKADFVRDIQPIFAETCYECHGPKKQKGGLRLDSRRSALAGGQTGPAIVPGDSRQELPRPARPRRRGRRPHAGQARPADAAAGDGRFARGSTKGRTGRRPPPWRRAKVEKHWAYVKPVRPSPPSVKDKAWVRNPIDAFVLARLEKEGLHPSPEADRATLIRRVSLDLTGLPPTLAEVDAFVADRSPDAYEKLVDRLLASPHYGEQLGPRTGSTSPGTPTPTATRRTARRTIWPYRDWVIRALNGDMPFDQFTVEQIAGDLLPNATPDQKVATGFHRNTMINEEGGIDVEEFRFKATRRPRRRRRRPCGWA